MLRFYEVFRVRDPGSGEWSDKHRTRLQGRQRRAAVRDPGSGEGGGEHRTCPQGRQGRTVVRDPGSGELSGHAAGHPESWPAPHLIAAHLRNEYSAHLCTQTADLQC